MPPQEERSVPLYKTPFFRILIVVVVLVIVVGAVLMVVMLQRDDTENTSNQNTPPSSSNRNLSITITNVQGTVPPDADRDGLLDKDEKAAGTDLNKIDTDGDGLSDFDEVKKYHSDPNKGDTDGDGALDGDEVKRGMDPLGEGKLFDTVPPATNSQ